MDSLINTQNPADNILYKITTLDQIQNIEERNNLLRYIDQTELQNEDIQKCMAAGMNAHISKPINVYKPLQTILNCIHFSD